MFLGVFWFTKNMEFLLNGRIRDIFRVFPGHFYFMRGFSLVELTGDDNNAIEVSLV